MRYIQLLMEHTFSQSFLYEKGPSRGNFVLALIAGLAAAFVGAVAWMIFGLATNWQLAPLALPIGALVGWSIGVSGRGTSFIYGVLAILYTGLACLAGQALVAIISATSVDLDLFGAIAHLHMDALILAIINQTSQTGQVIYGVSAVIAYLMSVQKEN